MLALRDLVASFSGTDEGKFDFWYGPSTRVPCARTHSALSLATLSEVSKGKHVHRSSVSIFSEEESYPVHRDDAISSCANRLPDPK